MRARDIMTTNVLTVTPITPVRDVAQLMVEHRISSVPVVHGSKLVGIITDGDLYRRAELGTEKRHRTWLSMLAFHNERAADYVQIHGRTARDVMTTDVIAVEPTTTLRQIADLFETKRIRRVPVVADGTVIGIVSRANLVQALATISSEDLQRTATDRQVRDLVIAEYKRLPFGLPSEWNVIVKDGIVHLRGVCPVPCGTGRVTRGRRRNSGRQGLCRPYFWISQPGRRPGESSISGNHHRSGRCRDRTPTS
jgi:CBS domain-containing protein